VSAVFAAAWLLILAPGAAVDLAWLGSPRFRAWLREDS
jgi:hypothetical protein